MKVKKVIAVLSLAVVAAALAITPVQAQKGNKVYCERDEIAAQEQLQPEITKMAGGTLITYDHTLPQVDATSTNWTTHNFDLAGHRYFSEDQINTTNVKFLAPKWFYNMGEASHESTPIVVDGILYVTPMTGYSVQALNAATGRRIWTFTLAKTDFPRQRVRNRGVVYGDGIIYGVAAARMFALDAKTGKLVESFGEGGVYDLAKEVVKDRYPNLQESATIGFDLSTAPQYYDGKVYVSVGISEQHIPGGYVVVVDGKTGKIVWKFNTVPQGPEDDGWEIAKDTWNGGARNGGGVWSTVAIDPELGMLYAIASNPSPDYDGSARKGINLFTNSMLGLDLKNGKLKWYFQQVHHEIWDWDSASPAILMDVQVGGKTVKAVAEAPKNGFLYILNRETGKPINPIVELTVPTQTDVPGEEAWPTQPIPFTASGHQQEPVRPLYPTGLSEQILSQVKVVPFMTPRSATIPLAQVSASTNFGPPSFSPKTGLVYVASSDGVTSGGVRPVGATLKAGDNSLNSRNFPPNLGRPSHGTVSAYDPSTAELVWQRTIPNDSFQSGTVVTSGDLVFATGQNLGGFYALDAKTGEVMYSFDTGAGSSSSPTAYMINGVEYISCTSANLVVTFALVGQ